MALYGFTPLAEHILVEAARLCHLANGSKLKFTIFDESPEEKSIVLANEHNVLLDICDLEFKRLDHVGPRAVESLSTELLPGARATMMSGFLASAGAGRVIGALIGGPVWLAGGIVATGLVSASVTGLGLASLAWGLRRWQRPQ